MAVRSNRCLEGVGCHQPVRVGNGEELGAGGLGGLELALQGVAG